MPKRRKIHGKSLLVAAGFAGMSLVGCDEAVVANLVAPDSGTEADSGTQDSGMDAAPVANLLPPPDSGTDAGDTTEDAGMDAAPVANLVPPPDSGAGS